MGGWSNVPLTKKIQYLERQLEETKRAQKLLQSVEKMTQDSIARYRSYLKKSEEVK